MLSSLAKALGGGAKSALKSNFMKGTTSIGYGAAARSTGMGYLGKYSIGGGAVRAGAYFGASSAMGMASDSIASGDIMGESSPAARAAAQLALGAGGMYAGYRGFKTAARGAVGSVNTWMPKGQSKQSVITGHRGATLKEQRNILQNQRINNHGQSHINQMLGASAASKRKVPVWGTKDNVNYGGGLINKFESLAGLPAVGAKKAMQFATIGGAKGIGGGIQGAVLGYPNVAMQTMRGFAGGMRNTMRRRGPGAMRSAATEGAVAFGAMSHPYAGAAMLGLGAGLTNSAMSYNASRRKNLSMPVMKTGASRPSSNYGPNVTLMAHRRNRGM